ncbi:MAG: hypothetical protein QCI00_00375 [Candidatus Thermoplasmatota archaeon]|nr:hypothetical protein [Candidatus Thermoplasmatota archaeon]
MSKDYEILKELRKAEKKGAFDSKKTTLSIDYQSVNKNDSEYCFEKGILCKDKTNHQASELTILDLFFDLNY